VSFEAINNEKELLSNVAEGDRSAFGALYKHYYSSVFKYVSLFEPSSRGRDELVQDIFVRVWEKHARLADVNSLKDYLFGMTRHLVFDYLRTLKLQRVFSGLEESGETASGEDIESQFQFKQYHQLSLEAMEKMPKGMGKVLKMSIEQGLSVDEIAAGLSVTRAAVKKQLVKAKAFVREYLRDHGELSILLFVFLSLFEP
jgi:RNA polymerase sigma factor (sigma-70 family)